jgi:anti-anti-sigma factor
MNSDPGCLELARHTEADAVHLRLTGELDYDTTPEFLAAVRGILDDCSGIDRRPVRSLHLDCSGLGFCDTMGLFALLTIRRETGAADVRLHLDHRSPALQRLLELTGTLAHLTGAAVVAAGQDAASGPPPGQRRTADSPPG